MFYPFGISTSFLVFTQTILQARAGSAPMNFIYTKLLTGSLKILHLLSSSLLFVRFVWFVVKLGNHCPRRGLPDKSGIGPEASNGAPVCGRNHQGDGERAIFKAPRLIYNTFNSYIKSGGERNVRQR
jgi:hypothetical protein